MKMKMKTSTIKAEALCWLRYGKRLPIVCTEVGNWYADVLGLSKTMSVEVETKISRSDLRAEFARKKAKHHLYQNASGNLASVPNYLYFLVPASLKADALEIVVPANPKAGIAVFNGQDALGGRNVEVIKPAQKLHANKPPVRLIRTAMLRMSSELCGVWLSNEKLRGWLEEQVRRMSDASVIAGFRSAGSLDVETPADIDIRADELREAVEGRAVPWPALPAEQQEKWRQVAVRYLDITGFNVADWEDAQKSL